MGDNHDEDAAVTVLKHVKETQARGEDDDKIVVLSTGVRARLIPIGSVVIQDAVSKIKPPEVPTFFNEDKGREEENPNHPDYVKAVQDYNLRQTMAATEVMLILGVELVDPLPEDGRWLQKLRYLERRGVLDLSGYDLEEEMDLEFLYKRFIAVGSEDLISIARLAGLSQKDVEEAAQFFQSK